MSSSLSWSRIEHFYLCPQKYAYRYEENLVGGGVTHTYESSDGTTKTLSFAYDSAMQFGTALHAALETIYNGDAFDAVTCPCEDTCEYCDRPLLAPNPSSYKQHWMYKCIAQFLLHYPWDPDPIADARNPRTRERGVATIHAYLKKWKREEFKVLAVEQEFELPFYDDDGQLLFKYTGRIDLLIRSDGVLQPWDHKSARFFGEQFTLGFKLSGQPTGYMKATAAITGETVTSACINGIKTQGSVDDDSFERLDTQRTPEEFDRWEQEVREVWKRIQEGRTSGFWPRHAPFACFAYNRKCEYYSLCATGRSTAEDLKKTAFMRLSDS